MFSVIAPGSNLTSDFKQKFGLPGYTWEAVYFIMTVGSGVWLIRALLLAFEVKDICTISELISVIKNAKPQKN